MIIHLFQPVTLQNLSSRGVSTAEYAMLIGLVGIISIVSLKSLGHSTHDLFVNSSAKLENQGTLSLLQTSAIAKKSATENPYKLTTDPVTGKIAFQLTNGNQGMATNTTSLDGDQLNTLGTVMIGNKLQQLADAETDPELKDYYEKLAEASFYLGGAEGELDDVPGLAPFGEKYTNADALRDVITLGNDMADLLNNPPPNFSFADFQEVMPLAAEVYNISQTYRNNLSEYISADGITTKTFMGNADFSGNGEPGSVLSNNDITPGKAQKSYTSFKSLMKYEQLKEISAQVLAEQNVQSIPVESTLINATDIDQKAMQSSSP